MNQPPKNFNPSPFEDDNEEEQRKLIKLTEALKKALLGDDLAMVPISQPAKPKYKSLSITIAYKLSDGFIDIFYCAEMTRANKNVILGFAFDWLVERDGVNPAYTKESFIVEYWRERYDNLIE